MQCIVSISSLWSTDNSDWNYARSNREHEVLPMNGIWWLCVFRRRWYQYKNTRSMPGQQGIASRMGSYQHLHPPGPREEGSQHKVSLPNDKSTTAPVSDIVHQWYRYIAPRSHEGRKHRRSPHSNPRKCEQLGKLANCNRRGAPTKQMLLFDYFIQMEQ